MNHDLQYSIVESVGLVTLNRPEFRNAITKPMWLEMPDVFQELKNRGARVIVITGHGDHFASGADLQELEQLDDFEQAAQLWHSIRDTLSFVREFDLPTIARIPGACIGGGCLLASSCDLRYASFNASFAIPVARFGIVLDDPTVSRLIALIGPAQAREMLFTGNTVSGAQAEKIGLLNAVVPQNDLVIYVDEIARQIAANAQSAIIELKRSINRISLNRALEAAANDEQVVSAYLSSEFRDRLSRRK